MILTSEQAYAIRAVHALSGMEKKTVKDVCNNENMPIDFAYKILKKLERAGIVRSILGRKGGYLLVKQPNIISLSDILLAVDEDLFVKKCSKRGIPCENCGDKDHCLLHETIGKLQNIMFDVFKEKTIDMLM